ncbi:SET domain-containing protein 3, partial [Basidiobolus ranarum]
MTSKTYREKTSPYGSSSEEDQGIIRCICGYSEDDGFTIQCETCLVWQHAVCVDIAPDTVPDKYLCDICMPRPLDFKKAKEHQRLRLEILQRQQKELFKKRPNIKSKKPNERVINGYGIAASQDAKKKNGARSKTRPFTQRRYSDTADDDSHNQGPMFLEQDLKYEYIEDNILADVDVTEIFHKAAKEAKKGGTKSREDSGDNEPKDKNEGSPSGRRRSSSVDNSPIVFMESASLSSPKIRIGVHEIPNEANPQYPQFGLFADSNISKGRFIVEYKGEVYLKSSYKRVPNNQYRILGIPKQFVLFHPSLDLCVDSRRSGNESRFVRKHCKPNAELRTIVVTEGESTIAHLGIFSKKPIPEGEEITIGWEWDINNQEPDSLPRTEFTHRKKLSMNSLIATFGCACMEPSKCLIYKIFKSEVEDNSSSDSSDDKMKINRVIKVNGRQEASDEDFDVDNLSGEDSFPKVMKPPVGVQIKRKPGRPPKRKVISADGPNIKGPKTPGKRRKDREGSNSHSSPLPELSSDGSVSLEKEVHSEFKSRVKHRYNSSPIISSDEEMYGHKGRNSSDRRNKRSSFSPMESSGDEGYRSPSKRAKTNIARVGLKKYWIQRYQGCETDPKGKKAEPESPEKNSGYESVNKITITSNDGVDIDNTEDGDIIVDEPKAVDDVPSKYRSPLDSPHKNDIPSKDSISSSNVELNEKPEVQQEQVDLQGNSHGTKKVDAPELSNLTVRSKSLTPEQESLEDVNISDDLSVPSSPDSHQIVEIDVVGDSPETITLRVDSKPLVDKPQVKPVPEKSFEKSSAKSQPEPVKEELSSEPVTEETPLKECTPDQSVKQTSLDKESPIKKIQESLEVMDTPSQQVDNISDSAKVENTTTEETVEPSSTAPTKVKLSLKEYQENLRKVQKAHQEESQPLTQNPSEPQEDGNKGEEAKPPNTSEETTLNAESENTGTNTGSAQGKVKISLQEYNLKRKRESNLSSTSKPNAETREDGGQDKPVDHKLEDVDGNEKEKETKEKQDIPPTSNEDLGAEIAPIKFEEQVDLIPVPKTEYFPVSFPVKDLSVDTSVLEIENQSDMKVETSSHLDKEPRDISIDTTLASNSKDEPEDPHEPRNVSESAQAEDIDTPSPSPSSVKSEDIAPAVSTTHPNPSDSTSTTSYQSKPYDPANPEDPTEDGPDHPKDLNDREADYYGQRPGPLSSNPNLPPSRRSDSYRPGYRFEFRDARERESRERDYRDMNMNAAGLPSGPGWSDDRYQRDRMRDRERERDKDRGRAHKDWATRDSYRRFNGIYRDRDYPFGREGYEVENRYSGRMKPNSFGVAAPDYRDNRYGGFRANNYPLPPSVPFN